MILSFAEGFLLGIGAAVPLGPINVLIMNVAIKNYKSGMAIGFGAMSVDILYFSLIFFGLISFLNTPFILKTLGFFGSSFLLYSAYLIFKNRNKKLSKSKEKINKKNLLKLYLSGCFLSFLNPYAIAFWISIASYASSGSFSHPFFIIFGMLSSILLWITLMPYFVHKSKHKISQKVSFYISLFSSVVLFGFAISLFAKTFLF